MQSESSQYFGKCLRGKEDNVYTVLGIGELLWDMLPEGPQLGGAPANFGVMAARLGNHATVISRIGQDPLGDQALEVLRPFPVDCSQLQRDRVHPTGRVTVTLNEGQPSYTIHQPVAWDFFELTESWLTQAAQADAVCFGSLAQRSERSRKTIQALVAATRTGCQRIFDVNLRAPFYTAEIVRESLKLATVMKMNDLEVPLVLDQLGLPEEPELHIGAKMLLAEFPNLSLIAITCGGEGSLLVTPSESHRHPGVHIKVAAAMTSYLLRGAPLATLNEAGNRWGSFIASQHGAMPEISPETLARITAEIEA
jgi:fructokinase